MDIDNTKVYSIFYILFNNIGVSLGFFYRELSAAGGYDWLPAPLGWKLANARTL
jgi:hypothetical protein